ncbi:DNA repair protein RecO [Bacillaceae bacterium ZC4]|nr:DNA repair protein RecO [Bacillaceae bacterium ZC4]
MLVKTEGIVIRTTEYGETNKVVIIYTREFGKVGVMARGANKPNSRLAAVTQLFTYGNFLYHQSSGLGNLSQGEIISAFREIKENIFLTAYASYIVELLDKGTDEKDRNPFLFELLFQTLHLLNEEKDAEILTNIFEIKMLNVLGLYPELNRCAVSGETNGPFHFSLKENGLICSRCFEKDPYRLNISQKTVKLLRLFYSIDLNRIGQISVSAETKKELRFVLDQYYQEYAGLSLKSKKFLNQLDSLKEML